MIQITSPCHGHGEHIVQFYERDEFLYAVVADFLRGGLVSGEAAVVIATAPHVAGFREALAARGVDAAAHVATGRLAFVDAHETLASFMEGDRPDGARFAERIVPFLEKAARVAPGVPVRAYGEMVDILWREGRTASAIRPHVVLLDIGLPGLDGYEVARRLRAEHGRHLLLVALTGYGQEDDRRRTVEAGFDHHLVKPLDLDALSELLGAR